MPAVRHTPPRRRMTCPTCGRDVSYTLPWKQGRGIAGGQRLVRDYDRRVLKDHTNPETGTRCTVNGPHGFGLDHPHERG